MIDVKQSCSSKTDGEGLQIPPIGLTAKAIYPLPKRLLPMHTIAAPFTASFFARATGRQIQCRMSSAHQFGTHGMKSKHNGKSYQTPAEKFRDFLYDRETLRVLIGGIPLPLIITVAGVLIARTLGAQDQKLADARSDAAAIAALLPSLASPDESGVFAYEILGKLSRIDNAVPLDNSKVANLGATEDTGCGAQSTTNSEIVRATCAAAYAMLALNQKNAFVSNTPATEDLYSREGNALDGLYDSTAQLNGETPIGTAAPPSAAPAAITPTSTPTVYIQYYGKLQEGCAKAWQHALVDNHIVAPTPENILVSHPNPTSFQQGTIGVRYFFDADALAANETGQIGSMVPGTQKKAIAIREYHNSRAQPGIIEVWFPKDKTFSCN